MGDNTQSQSMSRLAIRKAVPADLPLLEPLVQSAYRGESSRKGWTTEADLIAGTRIASDSLLLKINNPRGAVLIGFPAGADGAPQPEEHKPLACCEVVLSDDGKDDDDAGAAAAAPRTSYFGLFAVDPERQGGGIGGTMLARAEAYARDTLGAARIEMWVIWTRQELIAWYMRRGYSQTGGKMPWPYGNPENGDPLRDDLYFDVLVKDLV